MINFSQALVEIKQGQKACRSGWRKDQWVQAQFPDEHSKMTNPYLYLRNVQGELVPWTPSQGDLFATDWEYC